MKKLLLLLIIVFPIFSYAEYNGVHAEFEIELKNGYIIPGYKYIAHGSNSLEYKEQLENDPESFLFNEFTYEPGEYGCYSKRLEYPYEEIILYKLIKPVEIKINEIKKVVIIDLIAASYDIQIVGDYKASDQSWMNSKPIVKYSDFEEMCTYDTFIHLNGSISPEALHELKEIVDESESEIKKNEAEWEIMDRNDEFYEEKVREIHKERNSRIIEILKMYKQLKTVTVSMCTC